jgi:hypothetical protein
MTPERWDKIRGSAGDNIRGGAWAKPNNELLPQPMVDDLQLAFRT